MKKSSTAKSNKAIVKSMSKKLTKVTKSKLSESLDEVKNKTKDLILKAQYKKAEKYLISQKKNYPNEYYILSKLATLQAELTFSKSDKIMSEAFSLAASKLKKLLNLKAKVDSDLKYRNLNEYYWFSQQHLKQYNLGSRAVKKRNSIGYYSMGVGAANHAYKLKLSGNNKSSLVWAKKAEIAWLNYFKYRTQKYFDPWAWYALSLGLQGDTKGLEKALRKSAKLSSRSLSDPFFKKIRRMAGVKSISQ